jgi:hypothetical protein
MVTESFDLPEHWACALVNGDESGMDDADCRALQAFTDWMVKTYGQCWCLDVTESQGFQRYHDAHQFGVLACEVATFTFDISLRGKA